MANDLPVPGPATTLNSGFADAAIAYEGVPGISPSDHVISGIRELLRRPAQADAIKS
jgi:hypothetical protein